jgi:hypothetical protein
MLVLGQAPSILLKSSKVGGTGTTDEEMMIWLFLPFTSWPSPNKKFRSVVPAAEKVGVIAYEKALLPELCSSLR